VCTGWVAITRRRASWRPTGNSELRLFPSYPFLCLTPPSYQSSHCASLSTCLLSDPCLLFSSLLSPCLSPLLAHLLSEQRGNLFSKVFFSLHVRVLSCSPVRKWSRLKYFALYVWCAHTLFLSFLCTSFPSTASRPPPPPLCSKRFDPGEWNKRCLDQNCLLCSMFPFVLHGTCVCIHT